MPISGLVLTLHDPVQTGAEVLRRLETDDRFVCGPPLGDRLPVVLETPDDESARQAHEWLAALPGVGAIHVAFVGFDNS